MKKVGRFFKRNWLGLTLIGAGVTVFVLKTAGMDEAADAVADAADEMSETMDEMEVE